MLRILLGTFILASLARYFGIARFGKTGDRVAGYMNQKGHQYHMDRYVKLGPKPRRKLLQHSIWA